MRTLTLTAALALLSLLKIADASAASLTTFLDYDVTFGARGTDLITGTATLNTKTHTFITDITVTGPVDPGTYTETLHHYFSHNFSSHDLSRLGSFEKRHDDIFLEGRPSGRGFSPTETFVSFEFDDGGRRIHSTSVSAVPLPSTWGMMLVGLCSLGFIAWRQKSGIVRPAPIQA
jgi:hypothetical protein